MHADRVQRSPDLRRRRTVARDNVKEYAMLPAEFAALEPYSDWVLETEPQRYAKCLASTAAETEAFCDAAFPLLEPAMAHLSGFPLSGLPRPQRNLLLLVMSLITVSSPVEVPPQRGDGGIGLAGPELPAGSRPAIPRLRHAKTGRHA